ncbi:siderophore-interacting protein [Photobacterium sanctipauli]|uniref:Siderophore-interacting protein n=1 Tax=Photobacterium sanctipauli TaxID=1342794 RepID=A0A2T3P0K1_9GAMM|nr:siderophore-interacting protein [Photobacterium sanctipauli]PSW22030.1 siderophore-interacting protein [Photobacterium sanctipauli]
MKQAVSRKTLVVQNTDKVTPNMLRITLGGGDIDQFSTESVGQYIKFLFTPSGSTDVEALFAQGQKPMMRTFTISGYDEKAKAVTIDMALHDVDASVSVEPGIGGYASVWALNAKAGDTISVVGPKAIQGIPLEGEHYLLIADMTSLTAMAAKLAELPTHAKGHVVIDVPSEQDAQPLPRPEGMELVVNVSSKQSLSDAIKALPWQENSDIAVWCACEFSQMREIRRYINSDKGVDRKLCYLSSYWKQGVTEDGHKVLKREDNAALEQEGQ